MYSGSMEDYAQLTFHFANGESETYNLYTFAQTANGDSRPLIDILGEGLASLLKNEWIILQLPEESVCIHLSQVNRLSIKPNVAIPGALGDGERLTPLSRNR